MFAGMRCGMSVMTSVNLFSILFTYRGRDGSDGLGGQTLASISDSVLGWLWSKKFKNLL
jgi:hypothetical protein